MNPIITTALMTFGAGFTGAALSKAEGPGRALDDIMTIVGFEKLHEVAEKKRAIREQNIQEYKESIAQEIVKIPENDIQEPLLSIVGPALDASKYYIEERHLRVMFAKLIAASMDKNKNLSMHPSFVEIIKQLSTLDAKVINSFDNILTHPVGKFILKPTPNQNQYFKILDDFYLLKNSNYDLLDLAQSTSNLVRLGLISIDPYEQTKDVSHFYEDPRVNNFLVEHRCELKFSRMDLTHFGRTFKESVI